MKITTLYTCGQCGYQSSKWIGKCPECEAWNSFSAEEIKKETAQQRKIQSHTRTPQAFKIINQAITHEFRTALRLPEVDRVMGGGIVSGSLTLLTGEPGIGKSTLTLQIAEQLSAEGKKVLYISGEESEEQISMRGARLGLTLEHLKLLNESNLETALAT